MWRDRDNALNHGTFFGILVTFLMTILPDCWGTLRAMGDH